MVRRKLSSPVAVLAALALCEAACSTISTAIGEVTGSNEKKRQEEKAAHIQVQTMQVADSFVDQMLDTAGRIRIDTPEQRLAVLGWQTRQATAAYDIASGENPYENAVDLTVLVTLGRNILESYWIPTVFGDTAQPLLSVYVKLETRSWALVRQFATPEQEKKIQSLIYEWLSTHREVREVAFVRLSELLGSSPSTAHLGTPGELLEALGLNPFAGFDPAVTQVQRSRILGERALFFAKRWPRLLEIQTRQLTVGLAVEPPAGRLLASFERTTQAVEAVAKTAGELPDRVAAERERTIRQVMGALQSQEGQARALAADIRQTLAAGQAASTALHGALGELDLVTARLTAPSSRSPQAPPFDIREYTRTLEQADRTTRDLQELLRAADQDAPHLAGLLGSAGREAEERGRALGADLVADAGREAELRGRALVDHAFWRALILIGAMLAAAVAYRKLTPPARDRQAGAR